MSQVSDLVTRISADVAAERTQEQSVLALIAGIPGLIKAAVADALAANPSLSPDDLASFTAAAADIEAQTGELAAAVAANTPSTPPATNSAAAASADTTPSA